MSKNLIRAIFILVIGLMLFHPMAQVRAQAEASMGNGVFLGKVSSVKIEEVKITPSDGAEEIQESKLIEFNEDGTVAKVTFYDKRGFIERSIIALYDSKKRICELSIGDSENKTVERFVYNYTEDGKLLESAFNAENNLVSEGKEVEAPDPSSLYETKPAFIRVNSTAVTTETHHVYKTDKQGNWTQRIDYIWPQDEVKPMPVFSERRTISYFSE